ncbi:MAG: nitroreductase family protein [Dehalococcoidia bacterium]|nr:nitroreductase family protein [Dehalococcoidia bacterium]
MTIKDLVSRNRSYRRFNQEVDIKLDTLWELVDLARLSASAANMQPLRYIVCSDRDKNAAIFGCLAWAAYLKDWPGPAEGERPAGYIIMLEDTGIAHPLHCDHGIAAQSILLGATEKGLGGCIIGGINKPGLRNLLEIPEQYEILLVLALGQPRESVVIEPLGPEGDVRYWRDENGVHHVPKRSLKDIVLRSL